MGTNYKLKKNTAFVIEMTSTRLREDILPLLVRKYLAGCVLRTVSIPLSF